MSKYINNNLINDYKYYNKISATSDDSARLQHIHVTFVKTIYIEWLSVLTKVRL